MRSCLLVLALSLSLHSSVYAERVASPADFLDKPDGRIILSLINDTDVDCIALKDEWYIVSVEVFIATTDLTGQDKIRKEAILHDAKNNKIGVAMETVAVDKMNGIRDGKERSSANIIAYLHRKHIKKALNKPLIIEEYKLSAKDIHDLMKKNKCSGIADCLPDKILKKRIGPRASAPTFQQDQLDNKTFGVGKVNFTDPRDTRKDLDVPRLTMKIQLGGQTLYSFETVEGTSYREIHQLFAYNGHWILEYKQRDAVDKKQPPIYSGKVMRDGINLTAKYSLREMFSYGYINEKPFYFFRSDTNNGGISYDGVVLPLEYGEIQHYLCCADSGFNPRVYKDMVGFFATRNGALYYVEAGVY